jgi:hypothetical protein
MQGRHGRHARPGRVPQPAREPDSRPGDAPPPAARPTESAGDADAEDDDPLLDAASKLL